jgi:hypothetical protein
MDGRLPALALVAMLDVGNTEDDDDDDDECCLLAVQEESMTLKRYNFSVIVLNSL